MLYVVAVTTIATTYDVPVGILASVIPEVASIRRLYIGLRVRYKYYRKKQQSFSFGMEPPTRRSQSKSAHKCIPYNNRCVQNFIQIG